MQHIQEEYNTHKQNPPIARNLPPIASRIAWSRQLYQKLSEPVKQFHLLPGFLEQAESRKAIRGYNRLAQVLVEYELLHLELWKEKLNHAKHSLTSTVLIKDPSTNNLMVNFDPLINEFLREVQVLGSMNIEIPMDALSLYSQKSTILENYNTIKVSIPIINSNLFHFYRC